MDFDEPVKCGAELGEISRPWEGSCRIQQAGREAWSSEVVSMGARLHSCIGESCDIGGAVAQRGQGDVDDAKRGGEFGVEAFGRYQCAQAAAGRGDHAQAAAATTVQQIEEAGLRGGRKTLQLGEEDDTFVCISCAVTEAIFGVRVSECKEGLMSCRRELVQRARCVFDAAAGLTPK